MQWSFCVFSGDFDEHWVALRTFWDKDTRHWVFKWKDELSVFEPSPNFTWADNHPILSENYCAYVQYNATLQKILVYSTRCDAERCCAICEGDGKNKFIQCYKQKFK